VTRDDEQRPTFGGISGWRSTFWVGLVMMALWWTLVGLSVGGGIPWMRVATAIVVTVGVACSAVRWRQLSRRNGALCTSSALL
jgi:hypothetical protein